MIHYLSYTSADDVNILIIECETFLDKNPPNPIVEKGRERNDDLSSNVHVKNFAECLLEISAGKGGKTKAIEFAYVMGVLSEIRGTWHEFVSKPTRNINAFVQEEYHRIAVRFNLHYSTN